MKKCLNIFCVIFILMSITISFPTFLIAQSSRLSGTISDSKTGKPLPSANILIEGTSIGVASDMEGEFYISNIPPGECNLIVKYLGYNTKRVNVTLVAGRKIELDIELDYAAISLDSTVVVQGQAQGQIDAINQQLNARAIVNVVSSEKIREMPDANAAESVGRLPGVSVQRDGGEGQKLVIRGLAPKYSAISIEGVRIPPTDAGDRSTDLSMIGTYTLDGITVMKAITPDHDADAIGGSVDFKIKEANGESGKILYDVIAKGTYTDLKGTAKDHNLFGEVSTRMLDNSLGLLAQVYTENRNRSSHSMGAGYGLATYDLDKLNKIETHSLGLNDNLSEVERYGGIFVVDYRITEGKIALKNILSKKERAGIGYGDVYNYRNNTRNYSFWDGVSKLDLMTNILNYEQRFSTFELDASVSHSYSKANTPKSISFGFVEEGAFNSSNYDIHPSEIPSFALGDISGSRLDGAWDNSGKSSDRQITTSLNLEVDYYLSSYLSGKLKLGGKIRYSERENDGENYGGLLWIGTARPIREALKAAFPERLVNTDPSGWFYFPEFLNDDYDNSDFLEGRYTFGSVADSEFLNDVMKVIRKNPNPDAYQRDAMSSVTGDYNGIERLHAGYIMTDLNIGSMLTLIPGVRFEQLRTSYSASQGDSRVQGANTRYPHTIVRENKINAHWLPMVHVRLKLVEWVDVRFAYTQTLARPNYNLITPYHNISAGAGYQIIDYHNSNLKPEKAENLDLYLSFHHNYIGLFTIGGFTKNITDMHYGTKAIMEDPSEWDLPENTTGYHLVTTLNNKYTAKVKGIELDWQTNLWFLPGLLKGLVVSTNFTFIESKTYYPITTLNSSMDENYQWQFEYVDTFYTDRMTGQPTYLLNFSIGYDYKDFSIRGNMQYRSDVYTSHNFWPDLRAVSDDFLQYGVTATQELPWYKIQLIFDMRNITSASEINLLKGKAFPTYESFYGMTADFGVRIRY